MSEWYYLEGSEQVGPVSEEQFQAKVLDGSINEQTLVWQQGMADWQPYGQQASPQSSSPATVGTTLCPNCGASVSRGDLIIIDQVSVCPHCKEDYVQRIKEGLTPTGQHYDYGGFWIRFGAKFVDGLITGGVQIGFNFMIGIVMATTQNETAAVSAYIIMQIVTIAFNLFYYVFFVGKYQATPGKMACGLRIITADGGRVTYLRAFGRMFAEGLSGMILWIGYLMCIWDDEKRCLHDRICNTRVVRK